MPRGQRKQYNLTERQQRARDFIETSILEWRKRDIGQRSTLNNSDLAAHVSKFYTNGKRSISPSGFGAWRKGHNIPDKDSTDAIIRAFETDEEDAYTAFGHTLPVTLEWLYAQYILLPDKRETITYYLLAGVSWDWELQTETRPVWVRIMQRTLQADAVISEKAEEVATIIRVLMQM